MSRRASPLFGGPPLAHVKAQNGDLSATRALLPE